MKRLITVAITILIASSIWSQQSNLNLGLEYRPRFIFDDGYKLPKADNENGLSYVTQRTRVNAHYKNEKLETYLSVQDIRFWGDDDLYKTSGVSGNTNSLSLHQAWFLLNLHKNLQIKTGRQLFQYDDQRLLGARSWNDYQVCYDAVLFKFNDTVNQIDLGLTWNTESSKNSLFPDEKFKVFDFIRYQRNFKQFNISSIILLTGKTLNDTVETIGLKGTYGINVLYNFNDFEIRSTGYFQNNVNNKAGKAKAFCLSVFANQKVIEKKAAIGIGCDFLSGQDEANLNADYQNTNHLFDLHYGKRHGWYGYMDYFSTLPNQGLADSYLKLEYTISKLMLFQLDYHYFRLAANKYDTNNPTNKLDKTLGQEFDITYQWKIAKETTLQAGYSFFLTTNTLEQIKGIDDNPYKFPQFAYLMVTVKPSFKIFQNQ
ncbi:MAG: alginate export family protein [Salinivirgaceae bacterium]|nr:alginate export family protein [Salinivirgaceae bacterium]